MVRDFARACGESFGLGPVLESPMAEPMFLGHDGGEGCRYWDGLVCGQPASYEIVWNYAPTSSYVCTEHVAHVRATFSPEAINRIRDIPRDAARTEQAQ